MLQLLGARRFQATVIPREFHGRHVATSREIVVNDRGKGERFLVALAGAGFDTDGRLQLQDTKNRVITVAPHVAESAATEVAPAAPDKRQIGMVERTFRRRTEPEVPIQTIRDSFGFLRALEPLRPERTVRPVCDFAHRPDRAVPNPFAEQAGGFGGLVADGNLRGNARFASDFSDAARFIDGVRQRLLAKNMFALLHCGSGDGGMKMVRSANNDGVDVLLLIEKFAEVRVCGTAVILAGALLRGIIGVDDFLTRFAAGNAAGDAERMGQLNGLVGAEPVPAAVDAEQFADGVAEFVGVPLRVIRTGFIGVADGNALNVGFAQEVKHDAQTLGANTDKSDIDFVAGRNISGATQDAARNDRKANRGSGGLREELAPGEWAV